MKAFVVDTNVAVVANGDSNGASMQCQLACIAQLRYVKESGLVVIDSLGRMLSEYRRYLCQSGQPGVGDAFFRHLFLNQANPRKCEQVTITPHSENPDEFAEFPDDDELQSFDMGDRKFVAVALASKRRPEIQNAVDTDWWHARQALRRHRVRIRFLCPDHMRR